MVFTNSIEIVIPPNSNKELKRKFDNFLSSYLHTCFLFLEVGAVLPLTILKLFLLLFLLDFEFVYTI